MVVEASFINHPTFFTNCSGPSEETFRICPAGMSDLELAYDKKLKTLVLCQVDEPDEEICSPVVVSSNGNKTTTLSYLDKILNFQIQNDLNF